MKPTSAFAAGVGLGLLLGTKAGREKLDQLKGWATDTWQDPRVQGPVTTAKDKATSYVKEQGAALRDQWGQARQQPES